MLRADRCPGEPGLWCGAARGVLRSGWADSVAPGLLRGVQGEAPVHVEQSVAVDTRKQPPVQARSHAVGSAFRSQRITKRARRRRNERRECSAARETSHISESSRRTSHIPELLTVSISHTRMVRTTSCRWRCSTTGRCARTLGSSYSSHAEERQGPPRHVGRGGPGPKRLQSGEVFHPMTFCLALVVRGPGGFDFGSPLFSASSAPALSLGPSLA